MHMVEGLTIASVRSRIDVLRVFFPYDNRAFSVISVKIMDVFAFASFPTFLAMTVSFYQKTKK